jgi:hypothetical protein
MTRKQSLLNSPAVPANRVRSEHFGDYAADSSRRYTESFQPPPLYTRIPGHGHIYIHCRSGHLYPETEPRLVDGFVRRRDATRYPSSTAGQEALQAEPANGATTSHRTHRSTRERCGNRGVSLPFITCGCSRTVLETRHHTNNCVLSWTVSRNTFPETPNTTSFAQTSTTRDYIRISLGHGQSLYTSLNLGTPPRVPAQQHLDQALVSRDSLTALSDDETHLFHCETTG